MTGRDEAPREARIRQVRSECRDVATYWLQLDDSDAAERIRFRPGQYNVLRSADGREEAAVICSDPAEPLLLQHTISTRGRPPIDWSAGTPLEVRGPCGTSWPLGMPPTAKLTLIADGVGLAALRPLIYHVIRERALYGDVLLLYGASAHTELLYTDEYALWEDSLVDIKLSVDQPVQRWYALAHEMIRVLQPMVPGDTSARLLISGGPAMLRRVSTTAQSCGFAGHDVYVALDSVLSGAAGDDHDFAEHVRRSGPIFGFPEIESRLPADVGSHHGTS